MKKLLLGLSTLSILLVSGCTVPTLSDNTLDKSFDEYKTYKSHKAMAVAMDEDGRYAMGYSFDYSSQDRANQRAISQCTEANNKGEYKVNAKCELYAIGNDIVNK